MIKDNLFNRFSFQLKIGLHKDDIATLNYIQNRLNLGYVTKHGNVSVLIIQKASEVETIIDIFSNNPLNTKKRLDFEDWKLAYEYYMQVKDDKSRTEQGAKIHKLKEGINKGRSYPGLVSTISDIQITNY